MTADIHIVQELFDREQIREALYRFAEGLDNRDWSLIKSLCHETVDTDYRVWGIPEQALDRDAFVGLFQSSFWRPALRTQHLYTNFRIDLSENTAQVVFNFLGQHYVPDFPDGEEFYLRGEYTDTLVRSAEGWKIRAVRLRVFYVSGAAQMLVADA